MSRYVAPTPIVNDLIRDADVQSHLQTYCVIFTSPTSAQAFEEAETEEGPSRKKGNVSASRKKATKANIANILHMNGTVTPRSIAYVAVMVRGCILSGYLLLPNP